MQKGRILLSFFSISVVLILLIVVNLRLVEPLSNTQVLAVRTYRKVAVKITYKPTPTPTLKPTSIPFTPTRVQQGTATPKNTLDIIFSQINGYRASLGLYKVVTNSATCNFAITRAQEISTNFSHDGFINRVNAHTLPYPSYHEITENIETNSNPADVVNQWIRSPGHAENMRKDTPYVCVAHYGNYYAYEGWKP